jgi:hypothetical protein
MRNVNCPKTKVFVRCDAFGGSADEFEPAWLVSVRAMRNRPLCFQVWVEKYAACFDKVPPHLLFWFEPEEGASALPLHKIQMWECLSGSIEIWRKDQLSDVPVLVNLGKGTKPMGGHYWFTIDYLPEGQAQGLLDVGDVELLEEHKEGNVIRLENGQIAIYPNNRVKWLPVSLTGEDAAAAIPDWEAASNAQWDEWWSDSDEILGDAKWAY